MQPLRSKLNSLHSHAAVCAVRPISAEQALRPGPQMSTSSSDRWPVPAGLTLSNDAASWSTVIPSQRNYEAKETVFYFPASSAERLFCISRGELSWGTFHMTQSDQIDADCVSMKVTIEYYPADVFDLVKVCELKRKENQYGIGILTQKRPMHLSSVHFQARVVVTLPKSGSDVLRLKNFETDMPLFSHQLDNLASSVHFRSISLRTSNVPILVESFTARKANVETSNAPIEGSFSASTSLNLVTSNSHIRASVFLQNTNVTRFSELAMKSSNGPIAASVILSVHPHNATTRTSERGGNFSVNAATENGPVALTFPSAPTLCNLQLQATASLGPVNISPPKTFEGTFELQTALAYAQAGFGDGIARFEGQGGRMLVFESEGNTQKKGWVCSNDEGRWRGDIKVSTSMAPALLRL